MSIYAEAAWVISLLGATALIREAVGELCVHEISRVILNRSFLSGKDLDCLLSCSNGGRSLGFAASWRLRSFSRGNRRLSIASVSPLLCWIIGIPVKIISVSAFRANESFKYFAGSVPLVVGVIWIVVSIVVKSIAVWFSLRPIEYNYRRFFQEKIANFEAIMNMINESRKDLEAQEEDDKSPFFKISCRSDGIIIKKLLEINK